MKNHRKKKITAPIRNPTTKKGASRQFHKARIGKWIDGKGKNETIQKGQSSMGPMGTSGEKRHIWSTSMSFGKSLGWRRGPLSEGGYPFHE